MDTFLYQVIPTFIIIGSIVFLYYRMPYSRSEKVIILLFLIGQLGFSLYDVYLILNNLQSNVFMGIIGKAYIPFFLPFMIMAMQSGDAKLDSQKNIKNFEELNSQLGSMNELNGKLLQEIRQTKNLTVMLQEDIKKSQKNYEDLHKQNQILCNILESHDRTEQEKTPKSNTFKDMILKVLQILVK